MTKIVQRIARDFGMPDLADRLATQLPGSDLQSLLLEVYRQRAAGRSPADVLGDHERSRFVRPGENDPLLQVEFDRTAFRALPEGFGRIALAPVVPLGTSSTLAELDQNLAISTARNNEVISDPTNAMALECAVQRRALLRETPGCVDRVRLAASHRVVRAQKFDAPMAVAHFQLFGLVTAGRDIGRGHFEAENLVEHIDFYRRLLVEGLGVSAERIRVALTPLSPQQEAATQDGLLPQLTAGSGGERYEIDAVRPSGRNYYESVCFKVFAQTRTGEEIELSDGGTTTWTQRLLSDRKERMMISGIGTERACALFGEGLAARVGDT